jgi:hypothetical protein
MSARHDLGRRLAVALLTLLALGFGLGSECDPQDISLYQVTGPPPTRTASIREANDAADLPPTIELSRGVVLAVRCRDTCDYTCDDPVVTVSDPALLALREVDRPSAAQLELALIAVRPGTTNLTVETDCARKSYRVQILDD